MARKRPKADTASCQQLEKAGTGRWKENTGLSLALALPASANSQRATMQSRQALDAKHRGELFPVN
jgi:hypothetical protein